MYHRDEGRSVRGYMFSLVHNPVHLLLDLNWRLTLMSSLLAGLTIEVMRILLSLGITE